MTRSAETRFYDSFNARALEPSRVADTFVPSEHYRRLVKLRHSLVVGPRGTGKTTLLKMLQQRAIENWADKDAEEYRQQIDYTGVFVATDVTWKTQLDELGDGELDQVAYGLLCRAAFTSHVLRALCDAMRDRISTDKAQVAHRRCVIDNAAERAVVKEIARTWKASPALPTFAALGRSMSRRLVEIKAIANRERGQVSSERLKRLDDCDWIYIEHLEATVAAIEVFNDSVKERDGKWALLFDELELAPEWLRQDLLSAIRSVDGRLLFKLSMVPYDSNLQPATALSAMQDNDYDAISLTYANHRDGYDFCSKLWRSIAPQSISLGSSISDAEDEGDGAYAPGSDHHARFSELAQIDESFSAYLGSKGINIDGLQDGDEIARAQTIRKIISLVAVRHAFRNPDNSKQRIRSRKNPQLYDGERSVFAMVEGNPRWLIAIGARIIGAWSSTSDHRALQNRELQDAATRFYAMLQTIPCLPTPGGYKDTSVAGLVCALGDYFFKMCVAGDFNAEPPGSFIVDDALPDEILDSIGKGINWGAFVYVPSETEGPLLGDVKNKRFRLTYLLASKYRIPIRLGRAVTLTHVLSEMEVVNPKKTTKKKASKNIVPAQRELWETERD